MRKVILYGALFLLPLVSSGQTYSANFLTNGTATADSYISASYVPSYAFDQNTATFWNSDPGLPHWIQYQISGAKSLAKLTTNKADGIYAKTLRVFGSSNGTDWTFIPPEVVSTSTDNIWEDFFFNSTTSFTYFKIEFPDAWSSTYSAEREIEMYELVSTPAATSDLIMSTSTDASVGFFFNLMGWFGVFAVVIVTAWFVYQAVSGKK